MAYLNVSNAAQLQAALARAVGGDTILMRPGDYGSVAITGRNYSSAVTIQSTHFNNQAHIDALSVHNSSNIRFNLLDIGRGRLPSDVELSSINMVRFSSNISFNAVKFHGDLRGTPTDDLLGISVYDSSRVRITNSDFNDLYRGAYVLRSSDVQIHTSDFHNIRLDGVAVASTDGMVLHNNLFRDFKPIGDDHADAIQFWNTGQSYGSTNASIKNNVIWFPEDYAGANQGVQGIWIAAPGEFGFENFLIQNNLVYLNDRWNGISVYGGNNVDILDNTVMSRSGDGKVNWIRVQDSNDVLLRNNVSEDQLIVNSPNVRKVNNINLALTPNARNLFGNAHDPDGIFDLILPRIGYRPSGPTLRTTPMGRDTEFVTGDLDRDAAYNAWQAQDDLITMLLNDDSDAIDLGVFESASPIAAIDLDQSSAFQSSAVKFAASSKAVEDFALEPALSLDAYAPLMAQSLIAEHFVAMA